MFNLHAVRLTGFGEVICKKGDVELNATKYWLAANSWGGMSWGENYGFFRIKRGDDECGIESQEVSWGRVIFPF